TAASASSRRSRKKRVAIRPVPESRARETASGAQDRRSLRKSRWLAAQSLAQHAVFTGARLPGGGSLRLPSFSTNMIPCARVQKKIQENREKINIGTVQ